MSTGILLSGDPKSMVSVIVAMKSPKWICETRQTLISQVFVCGEGKRARQAPAATHHAPLKGGFLPQPPQGGFLTISRMYSHINSILVFQVFKFKLIKFGPLFFKPPTRIWQKLKKRRSQTWKKLIKFFQVFSSFSSLEFKFFSSFVDS